ncbi:ABC transporter permease [Candidatus Cyanaurora vandensis]|uniref:ABC transporter permease n=1 Tax=Candidatus Cyanaurora vandensis TaxID=2714958 RepID=UPI00257CB113|nr:ABC transporter permease [Candidatus Cyanaurora vandensis]
MSKGSIPFLETLSMAVESLWSNRLRTGLTMLGVVIGIASVIAITAVGQGVQKATEQQFQSLGTDVLLVLAGAARTGNVNQAVGSATTLTWDDAQAIQAQVLAAQGVTAFLLRPAQLVYQGVNTSTTVVGTDVAHPLVRSYQPETGRFFTENEVAGAERVVVLGSKVAERLFGPGGQGTGTKIRIQGERYLVTGVMQTKGALANVDYDDRVFIPLSTMAARLVGNNALRGVAINGLWVKARNQSDLEAAQFQVTNLLRLRHDIYPPQEDDFTVTNQVDLVSTLGTVVGLFTVLVVAIGGISLVVGGIGIANIMLVSVVERTREIGVRKALGATRRAVLGQFLAEAVVVSLVGGVIGIGLGIMIALGAATGLKLPFVISPTAVVVAFVLSVVVGLLAGVIPARNAARLDPIVALRSD